MSVTACLWDETFPLLHDMTLGSCQKFFDMGLSLCYELKHCPFIVKNSSILDFCLPTPQLHSCNYKVSSFAVFGSVRLLILFHLSKFQNCMNLCVTELFRKCFNLDCYSSEPDRSVKAYSSCEVRITYPVPFSMISFLSRLLGWLVLYWYTSATRIPLYLVLLDFIYPRTLYIWWGIRIRLLLLAWIIQQLQLSIFNGGIFWKQKKMQPGLKCILGKKEKYLSGWNLWYSVLFFCCISDLFPQNLFFFVAVFFFKVRFAITRFCCFNKGMWFLSSKNIRIMTRLSRRACFTQYKLHSRCYFSLPLLAAFWFPLHNLSNVCLPLDMMSCIRDVLKW